jgi:hypothetical protein
MGIDAQSGVCRFGVVNYCVADFASFSVAGP